MEKFFHVMQHGRSLGFFAAASPRSAVFSMARDADMGDPDGFLRASVGDTMTRVSSTISAELLCDHLLELGGMTAEDLSTAPRSKLDALARQKHYADWADFLGTMADFGIEANHRLARFALVAEGRDEVDAV